MYVCYKIEMVFSPQQDATTPMTVPGMLPPLTTINTSGHTPTFPGTGRSPLSSPVTTVAQDRLSPSLATPSSGMFGGEFT